MTDIAQNKSSKNRWESHAKILSAMPRFKNAIDIARKELNIPTDGIPYDGRADWYQSLFAFPDEDTGKRYGFRVGHDLLPPSKKFLDLLDKIISEFNLDNRWINNLFTMIYSGDTQIEAPFWRSANVDARMNDVRLPKNELRVTSLSISINKETALNDIRDIWSEVKKYQAYMDSNIPKRRDPILDKTVHKYKTVIELKEQDLTYKQIADGYPELNFNVADDVSDFVRQVEKRFKPLKAGTLRAVSNLWWHDM